MLIAGVGGQGILLISNILGRAAILQGYRVRGSEVHGMAQRGGSVVAHVRIGDVHSPLIPEGEADYLIALEPLEALRYLNYLREGCKALISTFMIPPALSAGKIGAYPKLDDIIEYLSRYADVYPVDAFSLAKKAGSALTMNVVMLGALSKLGFPLPEEALIQAMLSLVPEKTREMNLKAFELGKSAVKNNSFKREDF